MQKRYWFLLYVLATVAFATIIAMHDPPALPTFVDWVQRFIDRG